MSRLDRAIERAIRLCIAGSVVVAAVAVSAVDAVRTAARRLRK